MISEDSDLYREHQDWALKIGTCHEPEADISSQIWILPEKYINEHIMNQILRFWMHAKADYVKWDMNRSVDNVFSKALPGTSGGVYTEYAGCL